MQINNNIDIPTAGNNGNQVPVKNTDSLEAQKQKLQKASKDLESIFLYHMLQSMRKTVPENSSGMNSAGSSFGKDIYTQMFDQELASKMSGTGTKSLADILYRDMEKILNRQAGITEELKPLNFKIMPDRQHVPIKIKNLPIVEDKIIPTALDDKSGHKPIKSDDFAPLIEKAAQRYNLDPELIRSVIKAESGGDPKAISRSGAKGLMQLMDTTASDVGVTDSLDPEQNILGGSKYLRRMLDRFGDVKTALAAYNAGPGTVEKYGGIPPYEETQNYINKVLGPDVNRSPNSILAAKE